MKKACLVRLLPLALCLWFAVDGTVGQQGSSNNVPNITAAYLSYDQINQYLQSVKSEASTSTQVQVTLGNIGNSFENRTIPSITIRQRQTSPTRKPSIMIAAGFEGRDWIAVSMALYIVKQLTSGDDPHSSNLLQNFDWFILPVANPDGYNYSRSNSDSRWFKTFRGNRAIIPRNRGNGKTEISLGGVLLDRNFGFHWAPRPSILPLVKNGQYPGPHAFSEPETRHIRDWMMAQKDKAVMYMSLTTYGEKLLYPYRFNSSWTVPDVKLINDVGSAFITTMSSQNYTRYRGNRFWWDKSFGTSCDYAKGVANIRTSYTLQMSPNVVIAGQTNSGGFIRPIGIHKIVNTTWNGLKAMATELSAKTDQ